MLHVLPLVATLALGQAVPPEIVGDAITVRAASASGVATVTIPVTALEVDGSVARYQFPQPPASHILMIADGGADIIGVIGGLSVEFVGPSTIRLGFSVTAGDSATNFNIASGNLDCRQTPLSFAGASASVIYADDNLDGGGLTGDYTHPNSPVLLQFAFGAFYDQRSPLNNPVGYLISPIMLDIGHAARGEGRLPISGDLVPFPQPVSRINSAFSFTLSAFDTARGSSVYSASPTQRCGPADVASVGGELIPDTALTPDDIVAYLGAFFAGDLAIADLVQVGGGVSPDGQLTADDLIAFLVAYFGGCQGV